MKFANATNLDRKSGVAQWRDLLFLFQFSHRLSRAGLKFGYRPSGPWSDLGSIFEFPHRLWGLGDG